MWQPANSALKSLHHSTSEKPASRAVAQFLFPDIFVCVLAVFSPPVAMSLGWEMAQPNMDMAITHCEWHKDVSQSRLGVVALSTFFPVVLKGVTSSSPRPHASSIKREAGPCILPCPVPPHLVHEASLTEEPSTVFY